MAVSSVVFVLSIDLVGAPVNRKVHLSQDTVLAIQPNIRNLSETTHYLPQHAVTFDRFI